MGMRSTGSTGAKEGEAQSGYRNGGEFIQGSYTSHTDSEVQGPMSIKEPIRNGSLAKKRQR